MPYSYDLEPAEHGSWQWQITNPAGQPHAWGVRRDTKKNTEHMLKRICKRLNENRRGFNGAPADRLTDYRRRALARRHGRAA